MAPAGNLYASVNEMTRFIRELFRIQSGEPGILKRESLDEMWTPQFAPPEPFQGFGLGFALSTLEDDRVVRHGGAVYGYATELFVLPDRKLGVIVATSLDGANSVVSRIARFAAGCFRAARVGSEPPSLDTSTPLTREEARDWSGVYEGGEDTIRLREDRGRLVWDDHLTVALAKSGDDLIVDDILQYGPRLRALRAEGKERVFQYQGRPYRRVSESASKPEAPPTHDDDLLGEYGWDFNTLYIYEEAGDLHALIEWFFRYPLTQVDKDRFAFPDFGLYHGGRDRLPSARGRSSLGRVSRASLSRGVRLERPKE